MALSEKEKLINFLKSSLKDKPAILGVSSGIDSSLVLMLLARSIPREKIIPIFLPESSVSQNDLNDIIALEKASGIEIKTVYIENIVKSFSNLLEIKDMKSLGNVKSRIRMTVLYYYSNLNNGMVVGTTNLTEYVTGYFTKFGDGGCDVEPIIGLTKTRVRELSTEMGVPESIIRKPPSAGLWKDQTDERELGFSYSIIDREVDYFIRNGRFQDNEVGKRVKSLYEASMHKRNLPRGPETD